MSNQSAQELTRRVTAFLACRTFAVVGASTDRSKYGNIVFRSLLQAKREAYPVNPQASEIEGHRAYVRLSDLPVVPDAVSFVTPPAVTTQAVAEALELGIQHLWMQPGAESPEAVLLATQHGALVIPGNACLLVKLGYPR